MPAHGAFVVLRQLPHESVSGATLRFVARQETKRLGHRHRLAVVLLDPTCHAQQARLGGCVGVRTAPAAATEVEHDRRAVGSHDDVARVQVLVAEAESMHARAGLPHLLQYPTRAGIADDFAERTPVDLLGDEGKTTEPPTLDAAEDRARDLDSALREARAVLELTAQHRVAQIATPEDSAQEAAMPVLPHETLAPVGPNQRDRAAAAEHCRPPHRAVARPVETVRQASRVHLRH